MGFKPFFADANKAEVVINVIYGIKERNIVKVDELVVMPEHIHAILIPESKILSDIMRDWKKGAARIINRIDKVKNRKIWMENYFDEQILNEADLNKKRQYIILNPVKRGLVEYPEDFPFSTASNSLKARFS